METISRINLPTVDSTSTFIREMLADESTGGVVSASSLPGMTLVVADDQTKGRGQVGNSWETEQGKNIIFSLLCHPTFVRPAQQFLLSQSMALAVATSLQRYVEGVEVKWPNDIYVDDKKISGTLIECDIFGKSISNCIIGTGININQEMFRSDAPNPVSLKQLTGKDHDREEILSDILSRFLVYYEMLREGAVEEVRSQYRSMLYRREGFHRYSDVRGEFMAEIADVEPTGHLVLRFENGNTVRYEFKEVKFMI